MNSKYILDKAIQRYGEDNQIFKAMEEMSELITELARNSQGEANRDKIAGEIADVQIMCCQLEMIYGIEEEAKNQRELKLKRLYKRLKEPELVETEDIIIKDGKKFKHVCDDKSCRLVEV